MTDRNTKRPPNKVCRICRRKAVAPEKGLEGRWVIPPKKLCYNCTSLQYAVFSKINANKSILIKSQREAEAALPLLVLDFSKSKLIGQYDNLKALRRSLNRYRADNPRSKIKIIDEKYHDFTDYFLS